VVSTGGPALTARETEVLGLVQRRLTNAEIAAQLFMSVRTVESHVSALLRKTGVGDRRALAALAPAATGDGSAPRPLPSLRTELIGRGAELAAVSAAVAQSRLTTLVGPGGVGKTSVALAVAHAVTSDWPEGAVFVDLVPARSATDVLTAVALALGVEGEATRSAPELGRHLAERPVLIVLDNCEHVVDAVAGLAERTLAQGDACHVLTTSREPIGLAAEQLIPLEPLGPAAAELFVERARRAEPRVSWDPGDERIVELCARLDGLPLAVELAAGQMRRWSLADVSRRLGQPTARQAPGPARGDPRHHTMEAAIDWSYELLDEAEQRTLRHLAVFPSTFDLDAADALGALLPDVDVSLAVTALVDRSLVVHEPGTGTYRLLETIRAFAAARLDAHGERDAAFEHHRCWAVGRATAATRMDRWMSCSLAAGQRRDADHVRQAFWSSLSGGHVRDAVELAMARSYLWRNTVGCAEGHRWLEALGRHEPDMEPADRAWAALLRADIGLGDGDFVAMITAGAEAARHARGADADAAALAQLVLMLQHLLDPAAADEALAAALAASGDERLSNLIGAFTVVAHAARPDGHDVDGLIRQLRPRCSDDSYDRFILNWAIWLHGLAVRDEALAQRAIADQYEYLRRNGFAETWLNSYSAALTNMIDGVPKPGQLGPSLEMARREGYAIEGDCALALAYCELCGGRPEAAAELLGLARACRFNATAHHVLHGVVVEPLIHRALGPARHAAALERGRTWSAREVLASYGIDQRAPSAARPAADRAG
jgi:predicted ATPase/DNA-binding CsgD family transcriptional regulator